MGRGTTRSTITTKAPRKGQRTSQADRAAFRKASNDWYAKQAGAINKRLDRPGLKSELSRAELSRLNKSGAETAAASARRFTPIPARGKGDKTGVFNSASQMTARRAVERGKLNEQKANLQNSQRRGLTPGQAQARLTRLKSKQSEGFTSYTKGKGRFQIKERVDGGVMNQRFRPLSGKTVRTTGADVKAQAARAAKGPNRSAPLKQPADVQRAITAANRRARTGQQGKQSQSTKSPEQRIREKARDLNNSRRERSMQQGSQLARTNQMRSQAGLAPFKPQGRPIGSSRGLNKSSRTRKRIGKSSKPGRPNTGSRPPSRKSAIDKSFEKYGMKRDGSDRARTAANRAKLNATRRSPMTRNERRYFGNRRPSAQRLLKYRQLDAQLRALTHRNRVKTNWYQKQSARERARINAIKKEQRELFRNEGYGDMIDGMDKARRKRKRRG